MIKAANIKATGLILAILAISIILPFKTASAIGLKENSSINSDTIKLGDIFYDLPRDSDSNRVLGNAPRAGEDMVINARTLLRIAIALDLPWRPSSNMDQVTLYREATVIEYEQIENEILNKLNDKGIYGDYEINIPKQYHKIILPQDQNPEMEITDFNLDQRNNKFSATIAAPSSKNPIKYFKIKGIINPVITVPVLATNLQRGHIINQNDIKYIKIREKDFTRDVIVDAQKLVGMTARRMIIAERPIKEVEVIAPQIVKRGELVTLSLNNGAMSLTTQAKALENGAKGDVIRVVNTASNKTLQAIITGENNVTILKNHL